MSSANSGYPRPITEREKELLEKFQPKACCHDEHPTKRYLCDRFAGHDGKHKAFTILGKVGAEWD